MKNRIRMVTWLLAALLVSAMPFDAQAKSYSSGSKSYSSSSSRSSSSSSRSSSSSSRSSSSSSRSSSSSSHSSGGSSSRSSSGSSSTKSSPSSKPANSSSSKSSSSPKPANSSRSSSSPASSDKSFKSSNRKSYSSRSTGSDDDRRSYSSSKSYSAGSSPKVKGNPNPSTGKSEAAKESSPAATPSSFTFDTTAARARKEEESKEEFTRFKESQLATPTTTPSGREPQRYSQPVPPVIPGSTTVRRRDYVPEREIVVSRPWRAERYFRDYYSRPVIVYQDRYNNLFWWWLLDRSLEDRARWAYHHRSAMDPARYQALVANDQQLEQRVAQLEAEQASPDPNFVPTGMERDLMFSDHFVATAYSNRPTTAGAVGFWLIGVPVAIGACWFFIWLIWFKRWQTAT